MSFIETHSADSLHEADLLQLDSSSFDRKALMYLRNYRNAGSVGTILQSRPRGRKWCILVLCTALSLFLTAWTINQIDRPAFDQAICGTRSVGADK